MIPKIKIGIIDDHELFRKGLREILEGHEKFEVILEASDGMEFKNYLDSTHHSLHADVFLLDLKMPNVGGIECLKYLERHYPKHKTLVLTMFDDDPYIIETMKLGAKGYILKNSKPKDLIHAINQVHDKGIFIDEKISMSIVNGLKSKKSNTPNSEIQKIELNNADQEVLMYICQGLTNNEIGQKIHKSARTVEGYRQKLMKKSNTHNAPALVAWAFRMGYLE